VKLAFLAARSSIHTIRWVNALANRGHEVHLLSIQKGGDALDERVQVHYLPVAAPVGYYLNIWTVKRLLISIKPDILHVHYASGYGTLARLVGFEPTLLSVWGSDVFDFPYQNKFNERILQKNLKAATQIASTSWVMKQQTEKFVHPRLPIEVTPFGVDINKFKKMDIGKDSNEIVIGMVKRLEEKYGPRYLIQGTAILLDRLKDSGHYDVLNAIRLLIVGDGSQFSEMKELVKKLNLYSITRFTGAIPHDEVPKYLNQMDIFCAPSTLDSESFGVAVVEASACELPVIVTNVGGLPEVVKDGETGYIVDPKNPEQIAGKLYELVLDPNKRAKFGQQGRAFVKAHYDWDQNVSQMEQVYKNLIEIYLRGKEIEVKI